MKKLFRAGCLGALAMLAGCTADSSTAPSSSSQSAASSRAAARPPITLTTQSAGLVQQAPPNGKGTMMQLDGRFENAVIARRNADGSISTACHDEQAPAESFARGAGPAQIEVK